MTKPALKIDLEAYLYLKEKHIEKRFKENGHEPRPLKESEIESVKRTYRKFADKNGLHEVWDDTFCFTVNEMKKLLDDANMYYEETTIECSYL